MPYQNLNTIGFQIVAFEIICFLKRKKVIYSTSVLTLTFRVLFLKVKFYSNYSRDNIYYF